MKKQLLAAALCLGLMAAVKPAPAQAEDGLTEGRIKHVLLVSIDGLHALDVANYVRSHPGSALDELSEHGVTFSNARTPANSDSFPGLLALVTGGSPRTHGLFYDYSYDRTIWAPDNKTCSGPPGTQMIFDESIDVYVNGVSQNVIDPNALPRYIDSQGHCSPLYPHNAIRTNTVFEVIKEEHAGRTAWADKHPAYDLVNGRSGKGVDELYTPEITNVGGYDNTLSVVCTVQNDYLKVKAVLNQLQGLNHEGKYVGVPTVFGLNFQAVSVGQKLLVDNSDGGCPADTDPAINGKQGGYADGLGHSFRSPGLWPEEDRRCAVAVHWRPEKGRYLRFDVDHRDGEARPIADRSGEADQAGAFRRPRLHSVQLQQQRSGQDHHGRRKQLSRGAVRLGAR